MRRLATGRKGRDGGERVEQERGKKDGLSEGVGQELDAVLADVEDAELPQVAHVPRQTFDLVVGEIEQICAMVRRGERREGGR